MMGFSTSLWRLEESRKTMRVLKRGVWNQESQLSPEPNRLLT